MNRLQLFFLSFIVLSVLCHQVCTDGTEDWMLQEYKTFITMGSAFRIVNTLCGHYLVVKPTNRTDDQIFPDWKKHGILNPKLCECAAYSPQAFKYAFFMYMRAHLMGPSTYAEGPVNVDAVIAANKTLHILVDADKLPTYYEYEENGILEYDFAVDLSKDLAEKNRSAVFQEHYFSYVLRRMVPDKISFSFIRPRRSLWERFASEDGGIRAFVTDYESIPENSGNRTYYNAWDHYNFFKQF